MVMKNRQAAIRLLEEAGQCQADGDIDGAIEKYRLSIEAFPTADAHTYLGWMLSFKGQIEEAIEHCKKAIEIDPEFGNPYNDIGVYLMKQGKLGEAEDWFRRAIKAKRYEPRHFPHLNLGRIFLVRGRYPQALRELRKALGYAPADPTAVQMLRDLASKLNGSFGPMPSASAEREGSEE